MKTTEKQKMLAGQLYDPSDPELSQDRAHSHALCQALNATSDGQLEQRNEILKDLIGADTEVNAYIQPPFYCDYGKNISLGQHVFMNFNCVILDIAPVTIGDNTMFGPAVQIYTATHPINADERRQGLESGKPITIGSDVWIGGGAMICPGVNIGDRSVIGAGSVVTRDVPSDVVAAGNPAQIIRHITPRDSADLPL